MAKKDLKRFFAPRSVAVIGARDQGPDHLGRVVIENMRANGYKGDIHPVNLRGGKLLGLQGFSKRSRICRVASILRSLSCRRRQRRRRWRMYHAARNIGLIVLVAGGFTGSRSCW